MKVDLAGCIRGDKHAWDDFVRQAVPVLFNAVVHTMKGVDRNDPEVADRVQEVFIRLLQNDRKLLRSFDPSRASVPTWLSVIARSVTIDHLRKKRLATTPVEEHLAGATDHPPSSAGHVPDIPLHVLTERQRLVLHLLFDRGLSVEETAQTMGVDAQTVRSAKHKALTRLREHLGQDRPGGDTASTTPV